ncbi:MAG: restriction endonuclease subunit S [Gammaproteobacteria bacterium]|nr:restriction endonuclease subunit S [Gammaproteobacteria bacterium]
MTFENSIVKLTDLCTDVSYGYTASANEKKVGPKFLRITDIQGGEVEWDDVPYCEIDERSLVKNKLEFGDIVVARTGNSTGENYLYSSSEEAVFASYLIRFRVNPDLANPYFVWLQMRTQNWWSYVAGSKSGSAQAGANAKVLGQFELYLPERKIQDEAASVMLCFNDKLKLNRQTNQTLEQIAQAIFKSWFVDFEPVKAKIIAKQKGGDKLAQTLAAQAIISGAITLEQLEALEEDYQGLEAQLHPLITKKYPNEIGLDYWTPETLQTVADLFSDALVDAAQGSANVAGAGSAGATSDLGEIPEGWEYGSLSKVCVFSDERINVGDLTVENYISTENMLEGKRGVTTATSLPNVKTVPYFTDGHILVSNIRPYFMKIWLCQFEGGRSADVLGIKSADSSSIEYLYNLLYQDAFFNYMMATSKGAKMPRGDKDAIMSWNVTLPVLDLRRAYSKIVKGYYDLIENNNQENRSLVDVRDLLLPKLLSEEAVIGKMAQSATGDVA